LRISKLLHPHGNLIRVFQESVIDARQGPGGQWQVNLKLQGKGL
jgi:hypothetical protein